MKLNKNWDLYLPYFIILLSALYFPYCQATCEEIGCLGCVVTGMLAIWIAALFTFIPILKTLIKRENPRRLLIIAPIVIVAILIWIFSTAN